MLVSEKTALFTESVIREMTRLIRHHHGDRGLNLAQGFPDFPAPQELKDAACQAIQNDVNQYAITWGAKSLRDAIAEKYTRQYGFPIDPEQEVTVCCGATETMLSTLLALLDPGDEVVIFEPFYENYWPDAVLAGATPRFVTLHEPDWRFDPDELRGAFNGRTKAIVVNTPNNPTGKVFSRDELLLIAGLCQEFGVFAITDEIYEHLTYAQEHISMVSLPGMRERTITISGVSKTYSVTGWRIGWAIAPPPVTDAIRKVHDFVSVGAAAPLQEAAATALRLPESYYVELKAQYRQRRDFLIPRLEEVGFICRPPDGAYYVMADITRFGTTDDVEFARMLVRDYAVAVVPGSSFYRDGTKGRTKVRFAFPKKMETLTQAVEWLQPLQHLAG